MVRGGLSGRARRREKLWRTQNENIRAFLSTLPDDHKHVVLFEDLVADSAGTLQQVCSAMGLDFEPGMQAYQPRDVKAGIGDAGFGAHKGITPETADAWRQYYSEAVLQPETRTLMSQIWRRRGAG